MTDIIKHKSMRRLYDVIFFSFLATFIASLENMFPRPLPYSRIGFAFIIIVLVLKYFSLKELLLLIVIKNITVSLLFAYIFTPPFYLGLGGGIMSVLIMKLASKTNLFSIFGISLLGSIINNIIQIIIAKYIFSLPDIQILLPFIIILSMVSGSIVGIITIFLSSTNFAILNARNEGKQ